MWSHLKRPNDETKIIKKAWRASGKRSKAASASADINHAFWERRGGKGEQLREKVSFIEREQSTRVCVREREDARRIFSRTWPNEEMKKEGLEQQQQHQQQRRTDERILLWDVWVHAHLGVLPTTRRPRQDKTHTLSLLLLLLLLLWRHLHLRAAETTTIWCQRLIIIISLCSSHFLGSRITSALLTWHSHQPKTTEEDERMGERERDVRVW